MKDIPESFWYLGMVGAVILTSLFTVWYFKNPSITPSSKSGFWFGFTAIVLSTLLDFIFFSLGNMATEDKVDLEIYYGDYRFWIILVLVVLTAKLVGHLKRPRQV